MSAIRLYWYRGKINYGDYLSYYIVNKITGSHVKYVKPLSGFKDYLKFFLGGVGPLLLPWKKHYFCIGTILNKANKNSIVWGSGFNDFFDRTKAQRIFAVRGELSKGILKEQNIDFINDIKVGDPALLLPKLYTPSNLNKKYRLSIVPHYRDDGYFRALNKQYHIISVMTTDVEAFVDEIVSSEFVLSSSLHGIITAHAYGVPALWIRNYGLQYTGFKYLDYFSSVEISPYMGFTNVTEIFDNDEIAMGLFHTYRERSLPSVSRIEVIQNDLLSCCPFKD